jgi:hypothetical protein
MDSGELWLLDAVATFRIPVRWLVARNIESLLNRESHGLAASEITGRMGDLLAAGHIVVSRPMESGGEHLSLNGKELAEIITLPSGEPVYYGLTESGGQFWERTFHPVWSEYVEALESSSPEKIEVAAMTRDLVDDYVAHVYRSSVAFRQVILGSEFWHQLRPWQATYWKTLPTGWRLEFLASESDPHKAVRFSEEQRAEYLDTEAFLQRVRRWRGSMPMQQEGSETQSE